MSKEKQVFFSMYFNEEGIKKLRSYLGRVSQGTDKDWRTPFYGKQSREDLLNSWAPTLEEIQDKWPTLVEFENHLREKVGPLSIMKPWKNRLEDLDSYYNAVQFEKVAALNSEAVDATISEFSKVHGLRLRSQDDTVRVMKKSTNSGCPYFTKRKDVVDLTLPVTIQLHDSETIQFLSIEGDEFGCTAVVGWRGQEGGPEDSDVKQRLVWMFPFAINIEELRVYQPFIEGCQSTGLVPAWISMDAVDECMTKLFDTKGHDDLIVCTDFTKFDQHFNIVLQDGAYKFWDRILSGQSKDGIVKNYWLNTIFPIKYSIPIVTPDGVRKGRHGMASGSGGTNCDETIVHRMLQYEAAIENGARLNPYSQCLGDDGALSFPGISVDKVTSAYTQHGLDMNPSKQYADTETAEYLRRWYNKNYRIDGICRGVYSTYRAIGRLAGQERFYDPEFWSPQMVELRYLSIIENVKWHPLREKFAQWCMKGDKYNLGLSLPGFFDKIESYAKEATNYMDDFLGYTKSLQQVRHESSGINDWWIVKYLRSL